MRIISALVVASSIAIASRANAQEETHETTTRPTPDPMSALPSVLVDLGAGYAGPPIPHALALNGYSLGQILYGDVHVFPFASFRELGLVGRVDATLLSPNGGFLTSNAPTIFSVTGGPEMQTRVGAVILRGAVLSGARMWSDGVTTTTEPRVALQFQTDFVFGAKADTSQLVVGFFGGIDVVPSIGWSFGTTLSFAVF